MIRRAAREFWLASWDVLTRLSLRRPTRIDVGDVRRIDFPTQMRGRGRRLTEWARDRLRPGWLRVTRTDDR